MMRDKKGVGDLIKSVITVGLIAAFTIFAFFFIIAFFQEEVISRVTTEGQTILENYGNDTVLINLMNDQTTKLDTIVNAINIDLIFLIFWILFIIATMTIALTLEPMPTFNFLSMLFLVMMFLILGMNFVSQVFVWFVQEFITDLFDPALTYLPIFNYYVTNWIMINVIHIAGILLLNQFSVKPKPTVESFVENSSFDEDFEDGEFN